MCSPVGDAKVKVREGGSLDVGKVEEDLVVGTLGCGGRWTYKSTLSCPELSKRGH